MPAGRFQVGRNQDATLLMSKGNYFPLRVQAPEFETKVAVGAPVRGVTVDPNDVPQDKRPGGPYDCPNRDVTCWRVRTIALARARVDDMR